MLELLRKLLIDNWFELKFINLMDNTEFIWMVCETTEEKAIAYGKAELIASMGEDFETEYVSIRHISNLWQ